MKKYIALHKGWAILHLLMLTISALIMVGMAFVLQALTDAASGSDLNRFKLVALIAVLYLILDAIFDYVPRFTRAQITQKILGSLREAQVQSLLQRSPKEMMETNSTDDLNRLTTDLNTIENDYLKPASLLVHGLLVFSFSLIAALRLQTSMTLILLVVSCIPFLAPIINQRVLADKKQAAQVAKRSYVAFFSEFATHLPVISMAGAGSIFAKKLAKSSEVTEKKQVSFDNAQGLTYGISYGLANLLYSGSWIIGGFFVFQGKLTLPELIAMTTLMSMIAGPIQSLSDYYGEIAGSRSIVKEFLASLAKRNHQTAASQTLTAPISDLTLQAVSFQYADKVIFNDLSQHFVKGKRYAIIGPSGSGKSTLLKLLLGIYQPQQGTVLVGGQDLGQTDLASYYQELAYVPQKTATFEGTVLENISLFADKVDQQAVTNALITVGLGDWLKQRQDGLHGMIDEKHPLSGGEERRLDLARALYRKAQVIICDEPTTGLDLVNENAVGAALKEIDDRIVIVVTHATNDAFLANFDEILRLEENRLLQI